MAKAMTDLRLRRLLWLAYSVGNCKAFYPQYLHIMANYEPLLLHWQLGMACLTPAGVEKIKELYNVDDLGVLRSAFLPQEHS